MSKRKVIDSREAEEIRLLDREMDGEYRRELSHVLSQPAQRAQSKEFSGLLVRCAVEWLVIPAHMLSDLGDFGVIHPIPFRRNPAVAGIVNVRGRLCVAVHLQVLLDPTLPAPTGKQCMAVFGLGKNRTVLLVSELGRILSWNHEAIEPVPTTLAKSARKFCRGILKTAAGAPAGLLDEEILEMAIDRSLG